MAADPVVSIAGARQAWETLRGRFLARGYQLDRLPCGRGFRISRGRTWSIDLQAIDSLAQFAARAGIDVGRAA